MLDNGVPEPDKVFYMQLSEPQGALVPQDVAAATILNDDANITLSITDIVNITEGNQGTTNAVFMVTLDGIISNGSLWSILPPMEQQRLAWIMSPPMEHCFFLLVKPLCPLQLP